MLILVINRLNCLGYFKLVLLTIGAHIHVYVYIELCTTVLALVLHQKVSRSFPGAMSRIFRPRLDRLKKHRSDEVTEDKVGEKEKRASKVR